MEELSQLEAEVPNFAVSALPLRPQNIKIRSKIFLCCFFWMLGNFLYKLVEPDCSFPEPSILNLRWSSRHYQIMESRDDTFYLLSAHLDNRDPFVSESLSFLIFLVFTYICRTPLSESHLELRLKSLRGNLKIGTI